MNIQNLQLKTDILVYTIIGIEKEFNRRYPGIDMNFIKHRRNTEKRGYRQYDAMRFSGKCIPRNRRGKPGPI